MDTILSRFNKIGPGKFLCKMDWAFKISPPNFVDQFKRTSLFAHSYSSLHSLCEKIVYFKTIYWLINLFFLELFDNF